MTVYLDVIRRVREHRRGFRTPEKHVISGRIERIAAIDAVISEQPEIAAARDGRSSKDVEFVGGVGIFCCSERLNAEIDFRELKADVFDLGA